MAKSRSKEEKSAIVSAAGMMSAIWLTLQSAVRDRGGSDEDIYRLNTPDGRATIAKLADIIAAKSDGQSAKYSFPSNTLAGDLIPGGWEIVEDVKPSQLEGKTLEMISCLYDGDDYVDGKIMRQRAFDHNANLGLADAQYLLDHQDQIPVEFRGKVFVFAGTLLRNHVGLLLVACLFFGGGCWYLDFRRLDDDWYRINRYLR
jgi:hypothetical protein